MRGLLLAVLVATELAATGGIAAQQGTGASGRDAGRPRADAPDLTGKWVLNKAKSDFGLLPVPAADTATYTRVGSMYRVVEASAGDTGAILITYSWPVGSGEVTSDLPDQEASIQTRVTLHGDTAVFLSQLRHKTHPIEVESGREYLSPDGKVRTREFDLQSLVNPDEDTQHILVVFDRQ